MGYGRQGGGEGVGVGLSRYFGKYLYLAMHRPRCYQEPSLRAWNRKIWKYRDMLHATSNRGLRGRGLHSLYLMLSLSVRTSVIFTRQTSISARARTNKLNPGSFLPRVGFFCKSLLPKIRQLYFMAGTTRVP